MNEKVCLKRISRIEQSYVEHELSDTLGKNSDFTLVRGVEAKIRRWVLFGHKNVNRASFRVSRALPRVFSGWPQWLNYCNLLFKRSHSRPSKFGHHHLLIGKIKMMISKLKYYTVLSHNTHIFVRHKNVCLLWEKCLFGPQIKSCITQFFKNNEKWV